MHSTTDEGSCDTVALMIYENEKTPAGRMHQGSVSGWTGIFMKRPFRPDKSGKAFSPGVLRVGTTRASANVEKVTTAVADIDDGIALDELTPAIAQFSWLAYSSHSHTTQHPKFRIILWLSRPCTPEELPGVWAGLNVLLGGHCDPACKDPSRLYYLPSCPPEMASEAFFTQNEGRLITPEELMALAAEMNKPSEGVGGGVSAEALAGPIPPYPIGRNGEDFYAALCVAIPDPHKYGDWFLGGSALAYLVIVQRWPEVKARKIREAWERRAIGADRSKNDSQWDDILSNTKRRLSKGEEVTTHLTILKMARDNGWVAIVMDATVREQVKPPSWEWLQRLQLLLRKFFGVWLGTYIEPRNI